jgi:hypothetical protein
MRALFCTALAGALASLALFAGSAHGQPLQATVDWRAPAACPSQDEFGASVRSYLGGPDLEREAELELTIRVTKKGAKWRLNLRTTLPEADGERTLEATNCKDLLETAALIVALTIDPDAGAEPDLDSGPVRQVSDDELPVTPEIGGGTSVVRPVARPPPFGLPFFLGFRLSFGGDVGLLPNAAPGVSGALVGSSGRWRVELGVMYWAEQSQLVDGLPEAGGDLFFVGGSSQACFDVVQRTLRLATCAGLELGALHGRGTGIADPEPRDFLVVSATGAASARWPLANNLYFRTDIGLGVPLRVPVYTLEFGRPVQPGETPQFDVFEVHRPSRILARSFASLEMIFR